MWEMVDAISVPILSPLLSIVILLNCKNNEKRLLCDDKNLLVGPNAMVIYQGFISRTMTGYSAVIVYITFLTPFKQIWVLPH